MSNTGVRGYDVIWRHPWVRRGVGSPARCHGLAWVPMASTAIECRATFVGDLIDRGPDQLRVLKTVKAMVDAGSAQMVLGNHEFNALAYATGGPPDPVVPRPRRSGE